MHIALDNKLITMTHSLYSEQQVLKLTTSADAVDHAQLESLFNQLKPISSEVLLGEWNGGIFNDAHPSGEALRQINWAGKTFHSIEQVQPVILHGEQPGERIWCEEYGLARVSMHCCNKTLTIMLTYMLIIRSVKSNFVVWYLLQWCMMTSQSLTTFALWMIKLLWVPWTFAQRLYLKLASQLTCFTFI